jgi:two-component system cell cycle sensor histidine kinase/response regulator CckA
MATASASSSLTDRVKGSAGFRGNSQNAQWLQLAIGLAAVGYATTVLHRLLFLPLPASAHLPELAAAIFTAWSAAIFRRQPRTASLVTLAVVWAEPVASLVVSGELAASVLLVFPAVVAISGLVFGRGSAVITAAGSMLAIPLAFAAGRAVHGLGFTTSATEINTLIVTEFAMAGIGLITWAMVRDTERALATSERLRRQYMDLFEHSPNGLLTLDETTHVLEVNEPAARMLGLAPAGLRGRPLAAVLVEAGTHAGVDLGAALPDTPVEVVLRRPEQPDRHLEITRRVEAGPAPRTILALRDISEQRRADTRLRESEERFRSLIESVPNIAVQGYDQNRRVIFWNSASTRLYGFTADEAIGRQLEDLIIPPAMRADVVAAVDRWVTTGEPIPEGELTLQHKDGAPLHVLSSHVMQRNSRGEPEMYCIDVDLTERDRAAAVLQENEARFRVLFNSSNDAVMVFPLMPDGTPGNFIEVNAVACSMLEYTRAELLQLSSAVLDAPTTPMATRDRLRRLQAAGRLIEEVELITRRGRTLTAEISAQLFEFHQRPTVLAVVRDVSSRKSVEAQLRQAQKMEVVGRLAGGVAHDFNNILTAMLLNLEVMRNAAPGEDPAPHLADIEAMAKRAAKLTQQLLMFARKQSLQPSRFELNAALANLLRMLRRLLGEHIAISTETTAPQLWLEADPGLLDQVVMNLCLNARDAMPDGGTITLATRLVEFGPERPAAHPEARAGRFACLEITDTGCGMAPEVLQHLFEPFFTTKGVGQGTGLGLASVHGIVHQHQGWIEVASEVGRGTSFTLFLPCGDSRAKPASAHPFAPLRARRPATILLVEDEEIVRRVSRSMLLTLGYQVLVAADGPEALQLWAEHAAKIDLLLTDMVMPGGMTGLQLGRRLRQAKPEMKIVIMSGYSSTVAPTEVLRDAGIGFLAKPFDSTSLAHAIYHGLDPA